MNTANDLYRRLPGDAWRKTHRFSEELRLANELLHNSSAFEDEIADCLLNWCRNHQTCQFGKIAAAERRIHFCTLTDDAVSLWPDEDIAAYIAAERKLWKQRAAFDKDRATHSFILVVASPKVALAPPDSNLRDFAQAILSLAGWSVGRNRAARPLNEVSSDYLYLRNPADSVLYGFQFNLDFFACAGDQRWWHDHRFPGGIAFTANSLGHMRAYRDWYGAKKGDGIEWSVTQAMVTIDNAEKGKVVTRDPSKQPDPEGRVTWLRPLEDGKPLAKLVPCPLPKIPNRLAGKDWTKYEGYLHTDHAIRDEFFQDRQTPPTVDRPYRMDFTYIYSQAEPDFIEFSQGRAFTEDQVYQEIGRPEEWTHRGASATAPTRTNEQSASVAQSLQAIHDLKPTVPDEFLDL